MLTHLRRYLPLALGSVLALGVAAAILTTRHQLQVARDSLHQQALLSAARAGIDAELSRGERTL
jgi:hypothetical protein